MAEHDTSHSDVVPDKVAVATFTIPTAPIVDESLTKPTKEEQEIKQKATIEIPPSSIIDDEVFITALVDLINAAYDEAEAGIFKPGYVRTSVQAITELVKASELVVASVPAEYSAKSKSARVPVGCISIKKLSDTRAELGMFAVSIAQRGTGLGRDLIAFGEQWCRDALGGPGVAVAQLDLLVPTHFEHAFKVRLGAWYSRLGYKIVGSRDFVADYPKMAPLMAGPTEYRVHEKTL